MIEHLKNSGSEALPASQLVSILTDLNVNLLPVITELLDSPNDKDKIRGMQIMADTPGMPEAFSKLFDASKQLQSVFSLAKNSTDPEVLKKCVSVVGLSSLPKAEEVLKSVLERKDVPEDVKRVTIGAARSLGSKSSSLALAVVPFMKEGEIKTRRAAIEMVFLCNDPRDPELIPNILRKFIAQQTSPEVLEILKSAATSRPASDRREFAEAIERKISGESDDPADGNQLGKFLLAVGVVGGAASLAWVWNRQRKIG